jgi:hypothetical protein
MQFPITQKTLREDAQTADMELIAAQYRGRARVLQAKLFVLLLCQLCLCAFCTASCFSYFFHV